MTASADGSPKLIQSELGLLAEDEDPKSTNVLDVVEEGRRGALQAHLGVVEAPRQVRGRL